MLDRDVVAELLDCKFNDLELEIPKNMDKEALVEAFCQYVEDDYYEWLKDNFKSFFNHGDLRCDDFFDFFLGRSRCQDDHFIGCAQDGYLVR